MKYSFSIIVCLWALFSIEIIAQDTLVLSNNFNQLYEDGDSWLSGSGTQEVEDGFLVCQTKYDADSSCLEIMKIDHSGTIVWRRSVYCLENTADYPLIWTRIGQEFVQTQDGNFAIVFGVVNDMDWGDSDVGILKMDANANVLWLNIWEDDMWEDETNSPMGLLALNTSSDGGLIAAGVINHPTPHTGYVVKMDALGMIEWEWRSNKEESFFYSVIENKNGAFLAAGYGEGPAYEDHDLYAVRLSPEGVFMNEFLYPNKFDDIPARIHLYPNDVDSTDTYLLLGGVWDANEIANPKKQYIALLDENLEVIWEKKHPSPIPYYFGFTNTIINKDGSIIGVNEYVEETDDEDINGTGVMWYDNQGELEKVILYPPPNGAIDIFTKSFKATSDGGYIITGHIHSPQPKRTYVLKLDNDGTICAPENCVNFEYEIVEDTVDTAIDVINFQTNTQNILFYPNPVVGQTTIHYPLTNQAGILRIYNNWGQLVKKIHLPIGTNQHKFSLIEMPSGVYFLQLQTPEKIIRIEQPIIKK